MPLNEKQEALCTNRPADYSDLRALFLNCTLKKSPQRSHTQGLIDISASIMQKNGVHCDVLRPVDFDIAFGVYGDMTDHGWDRDDWPQIYAKVQAADILVLCTSIWLGEKTSVCTQVIERLYANSHLLNPYGQYADYGKVGGCLVTGNEDGAKHCSMNVRLLAAAPGLRDPASGGRGLARGGGPGPVVPGPEGSGGPAERLHQPQHHVHDVEPAAHGAHAEECRRHPSARQPAFGMGCGLPLRLREPGLPLAAQRRQASRVWRRAIRRRPQPRGDRRRASACGLPPFWDRPSCRLAPSACRSRGQANSARS